MYSSLAIVVLELADELPNFPLEAISLLFTIKRYRKSISSATIEHFKAYSEKSSNLSNRMYELEYEEKKEILMALTRGLYVAPRLHEMVNKAVQEQRSQRQLERQKATLQREVDIFESVQKTGESAEITPEKRKEFNGKNKEIAKISNEIKRTSRKTVMLGVDAEEREYWIFAGDKQRLYVRDTSGKEKWATYSTIQQAEDLLNALCDKGSHEKKLKDRIRSVLPTISLVDSLIVAESYCAFLKHRRQSEKKGLSYKERARSCKKSVSLPLIVSMTLSELRRELLAMEEKYWDFFGPRNIRWSFPRNRTFWVRLQRL
eukprot:TRINITY_DN996_c0_g1_i18.p1 TRINITY_DN996_c0_g1~~TRINITY_DN996_c0_g1_i18.p1  ORF type:complete len:317 (+),score=77.74 TRINITY_DN996_c0_g1_i18:998-1948(+)